MKGEEGDEVDESEKRVSLADEEENGKRDGSDIVPIL